MKKTKYKLLKDDTKTVYEDTMDTILQFISRKLVPKKLRYFILIDSWAKSTTGKWSNTIASDLKVNDMIKRIEGIN